MYSEFKREPLSLESIPVSWQRIESTILSCPHCGAKLLLLIYAMGATDPEHFDECACRMFPAYSQHHFPAWIVGPVLDAGPLIGRSAKFVQVWPSRQSIRQIALPDLGAIITGLQNAHCQ
jgi:hypothetical protein